VASILRARLGFAIVTPCIQIALLVWILIGTVWVGIIVQEAEECVRPRQLPESKYSLVFDVIGLYLFWLVVSCSTALTVNPTQTYMLVMPRSSLLERLQAEAQFELQPRRKVNSGHLTEAQVNRISAVEQTEAADCSICWENMQGAQVRVLPVCLHKFHKTCVDVWLVQHSPSCPYCKREVFGEGSD
jgi:hypothetical protein